MLDLWGKIMKSIMLMFLKCWVWVRNVGLKCWASQNCWSSLKMLRFTWNVGYFLAKYWAIEKILRFPQNVDIHKNVEVSLKCWILWIKCLAIIKKMLRFLKMLRFNWSSQLAHTLSVCHVFCSRLWCWGCPSTARDARRSW